MIPIYIEDLTKKEVAQELARELRLPIITKPDDYHLVLAVTSNRLELRINEPRVHPIYVDFFAPEVLHRLQNLTRNKELIARAVGIKGKYQPTIVDATAGFGMDAIILAALGCPVIMIERCPIIAALLSDALKRAKQTRPDLFEKMILKKMDAREYLTQHSEQTKNLDVIYLDPMFPTRTKSALVKKEMRILKDIVGDDIDSPELLTLALKVAKKRVVAKRPLHAPTLTELKPDIVFKGRACRFDVYLICA